MRITNYEIPYYTIRKPKSIRNKLFYREVLKGVSVATDPIYYIPNIYSIKVLKALTDKNKILYFSYFITLFNKEEIALEFSVTISSPFSNRKSKNGHVQNVQK